MVGDQAPLGRWNPPCSGFPQSGADTTSYGKDPQTGGQDRRSSPVRGTVFGMTIDQPDDQPESADQGAGSPLDQHLDAREVEIVDLADVSAQEIIFRSIVVLMSAAAEKLGLSDDNPGSSPHLDLDEGRKLITSLAGLVTGSAEYLGPQAGVVRDGLQGLQRAFREASAYPDEPGDGPGEKFTGPVY